MERNMNTMSMRRFAIHAVEMSILGLFVLAEASSASALPRAPQGLYATIDISDYVNNNGLMDTGDDAIMKALYDSMLGNPAISGLAIELHWDFAQKKPPPAVPNWDYVELAFTEAAAYGKTIHLNVTAGFNSPRWLWDSTQPTGLPSCNSLFSNPPTPAPNCGTVTFNYYGENTDQDKNATGLVLPLPWNTTYIDDWHAFLTAVQVRYGSNLTLVGITMAGPTAARRK
jgi:hypothetical protein